MKFKVALFVMSATWWSCGTEKAVNTVKSTSPPITGTWQLISGTVIEKGDTTHTAYNKNISFIKIINDSHFAFLQHDLNKGKDSAVFVAGGGAYSLTDSLYTEHLEYCSARDWEAHDFTFAVAIRNDTLVQQGIEKVANAGIDRLNIERYVRVKK